MKKIDLKKYKIPNEPGVYFFMKGREILYIGKATSLKDRTRSYFGKDLIATRGPMILDMVTQASNLKFYKTDSVLEALIFESNLIKKYKPKYNTKEKDNKSFNYVCITKDEIPKVEVIRGRNLNKKDHDVCYGPFPNGLHLRTAMKIVRKIFPYIDKDSVKKNNKEFYKQLGLVPNLLEEYKKNIKNFKLFFEGKKKSVLLNLKREMMTYSKNQEFEKANEIKKRIFTLNHINDISLIKDDFAGIVDHKISDYRIESYDIAHMSGKNMVGVMVVIENGEIKKNEYRKFIIKTQKGSNDTGALEEVFSRRLRHTEWGIPDLIVVDGGVAQINITKRVLDRYQFNIQVVSVVKDEKHKSKAMIGDSGVIKKYKKDIILSNFEAHRFAINFHKNRRNKDFIK